MEGVHRGFSAEPNRPFRSEDLFGVLEFENSRCFDNQRVLVEDDEGRESASFYGLPKRSSKQVPLVLLDGDVIVRGNRFDRTIVASDNYARLSPLLLQREGERMAISSGNPFVNLGRPGVFGSSGDHTQRRRGREALLVSKALDKLKERYGWEKIDLTGFSGGGHVIGMLLSMRSDIRVAVIASGNVAVRHRLMDLRGGSQDGILYDVTGYSDFVDPLTVIPQSSGSSTSKIIMLTDKADKLVSADSQESYFSALCRRGHSAEQRFVTAPDPNHHFLRTEAILAAMAARAS